MGCTTLVLHSANHKGCSTNCEQNAEQECHDGSVGQWITLPTPQLGDGDKDVNEASYYRPQTKGGKCDANF